MLLSESSDRRFDSYPLRHLELSLSLNSRLTRGASLFLLNSSQTLLSSYFNDGASLSYHS